LFDPAQGGSARSEMLVFSVSVRQILLRERRRSRIDDFLCPFVETGAVSPVFRPLVMGVDLSFSLSLRHLYMFRLPDFLLHSSFSVQESFLPPFFKHNSLCPPPTIHLPCPCHQRGGGAEREAHSGEMPFGNSPKSCATPTD